MSCSGLLRSAVTQGDMMSTEVLQRNPRATLCASSCRVFTHARRRTKAARSATSEPVSSSSNVPADKKVALITGANTGIGFETAAALGKKGYHVVLACRDASKASSALARLRDSSPAGSFETRTLVLDDLSNLKDFVKETLDAGRSIDVLVNNAGVMACPAMKTKDGFEYQFGVNHLGHFVLTTGLLPLMTDPDRESRIVTVSSAAHLFGRMQFDDINLTKNYSPWGAYGQSKLANILFAFELAKRLPRTANLTSNTLHPGTVDTELARYLTPEASIFGNPIVKKLTSMFLKTPEQGAATSIYLASSPDVAGITSKYYEDCKPVIAKRDAYDKDQQKRLWDLSCEMAGVDADVDAAVKAPCKA